MLKKLGLFTKFDIEAFIQEKKLVAIGQQEWVDYDTKRHLGTKIEVVIAQDKTDYGLSNGETINNLYEKLTVKVPDEIEVPMNVEIRLVNAKAKVYGEYRNQLSIEAERIEVVGK